jgi:hypothetical protein
MPRLLASSLPAYAMPGLEPGFKATHGFRVAFRYMAVKVRSERGIVKHSELLKQSRQGMGLLLRCKLSKRRGLLPAGL